MSEEQPQSENTTPVKTVVLLVDDQIMVSEGIRRMLVDEADIDFHYCQDPGEAVSMAIECQPTIILQDLIMPEIDGYTLLNAYRENELTKNIPVIVLSTKEDPEDKSLAFERGANDYLVKLPNKIELVARIRAHSKSYLTQLQRDEAFQALRELQVELEKSNIELQKLSSLDGLTGIANRRRFDEFVNIECLRSARENTSLSLILIDIDFFKPYNDNYGHLAGDACLRQVATALDEVVHRPADLVARYGGEEFVVVLPNTNLDGAVRLSEILCQKIRSLKLPHSHSSVADHVTISIGVTNRVACEGASPADLIKLADEALYDAKESGRDRYVVSKDKGMSDC
ncbi:MAG: diguanylate cyclase [Ectothiorhodospiraceae bacterium]|nr:diguanylate cyclase [Ectothiorhodospiraceae bacterium]